MASKKESASFSSNKTFRLLKLIDEDLPTSIPLLIPPEHDYDSNTHTVKKNRENPNEQFILSEKSVDILKHIQKPVAILAICGPGRSGKSFFLSRLLGIKEAFKPGHTQKACTRGIWLSTAGLECDEFVLLFLDSEGTGAVGEGETSKEISMSILTLTNLLSSFLIYNSKKVPTKGDLKDMSIFGEISTRIAVEDLRSKGQGKQNKLENYLPHFCWVLRDVPTDWLPEGEKSMTSYVKKILAYQIDEESDAGSNLSSLYPNLECFSLPYPGCKGKNALQEENLGKNFVESFKNLAEHILKTITPKVGFSKQPIDGSTFASLAQQYVKAINTPGAVPNLEQCWKTASMQKVFDLVDDFVQIYSKEMEAALSGRYLLEYCNNSSDLNNEENTLLAVHYSVLKEKILCPFITKCKELLGMTVETLMQDDIYKSAEQTLQTRISIFEDGTTRVTEGAFLKFKSRNYEESMQFCRDCFKSLCPAHEPLILDDIRNAYIQKAVGPAKDDVFDDLFRDIPEIPKDIRVTSLTYTQATVKWESPNNYIGSSFQYQVSIHQTSVTEDSAPEEVTNSLYRFENLAPATEYIVTVHTLNKRLLGEGTQIIFKTKAGPPNRPKNVIISPVMEKLSQIKVSFEQVTEADGNGSKVTKVVAKYGAMNSEEFETLLTVDAPLSEAIENYIYVPIKNVECPEVIRIQLSFENEVGEGESTEELFNTKQMIPGPPQDFTVVGRGHERIKLRWTAPVINPGAVHRYTIYMTNMKNETEIIYNKEIKDKTLTRFSAVARKLDSDTKYNFELKALNSEGSGSSTGKFEDWVKTKHSPAMRAAMTTCAAIGGTLAGPAIAAASLPVAGGVLIHKGIENKDGKEIAAGVAGVVTAPITATAGLVAGTLGAPVAGGVLAKKTYNMLDSDDDLADSDNKTDPVYLKRKLEFEKSMRQ